MHLRASLTAVLLVSALASDSRAGVTRVLVAVGATDEASSVRALDAQLDLLQVLRRDERLQLVDPATRYAREDVAEATRVAALAKASVEEVDALMAQADFEAARATCEKAIAALQGADFRVAREAWVRLMLHLARIKLALHVDDFGAAELAQALAVAPDAAPLRGLNTAERKAFDAARALWASRERAAPARLEAEQPGWVWVDGKLVGLTPVTVKGLAPGRHFITWVTPGGRVAASSELFGSITRVPVSTTITREGHTYRALLASLDAGLRRASPVGAARELRTWGGVDEVVVVGFSASGIELVRVGKGGSATKTLAGTPTTADLASGISALYDDPLPTDAVPAVSAALTPPPAPPASVEVAHPRLEGKVLLGAGIAAVVAGTALMVAARVSYGNANHLPQTDAQGYAVALNTTNALNTSGIAAAASGVVAGGLGVMVFW
jgi:hypothetical protein